MLTDKQIQERVGSITGTRAAIIEGKNRFGGDLYSLWSVMTGRSTDEIKSSLMMRLGHYTEPGNVAEYQQKTGRKCRQVHKTIHHPKYDRLRGHPDRLIVGSNNHGLECKAVFSRSESDWEDGVPEYYISQVKHYALITGRLRWDFSVLFLAFGRHEIFELEFTKQDIDELLEKELAFLKLVDEDTAPEVTAQSTDALKQEWKATDPELIKVADENIQNYVTDRKKLKLSLDMYKDALELCENKIRQRMENGETLLGPDGEILCTYKLNKSGNRRFNFNIKEKKNACQSKRENTVGETVYA